VDVPDYLLGCPMCGAIGRWSDDQGTLPQHRVGGFRDAADCPAAGTEGIDLGPREQYEFDGRRLVFLGDSGPKMPIQCPRCKRDVSVRMPPDGAFNRRLDVSIRCPDRFCQSLTQLTELREGPQGRWVTRDRRSSLDD
jgi:hypothetical protein